MVRKIKKRTGAKIKQKAAGMAMPKMAETPDEEKNFEEYAHLLSVPLKERAKKLYDRLEEVWTGQHSLEYWYGGFAVERSPETEIEFWERVADEYEKKIEEFPVRPRDSVFKNVMADALKGTPLGVTGLAASDESDESVGHT
jgi:hypothetical protein